MWTWPRKLSLVHLGKKYGFLNLVYISKGLSGVWALQKGIIKPLWWLGKNATYDYITYVLYKRFSGWAFHRTGTHVQGQEAKQHECNCMQLAAVSIPSVGIIKCGSAQLLSGSLLNRNVSWIILPVGPLLLLVHKMAHWNRAFSVDRLL